MPDPRFTELSALLPDEPQWIDLKGLLISERCDIWAEPDPERGFVARSWDYPFAAIYGDPGPGCVLPAVNEGRTTFKGQYLTDDWQLLAPPSSREAVEAALPGWRSRRVYLYRWEGDLEQPSPAAGAEIRLLPDGHGSEELSLAHAPETTRQELTLDWVSRRPITVAFVDSLPVTFCYAAFTTGTLWDVSIETLRPYRRRGLAAACFLTLARHMAGRGLTPAWGAMEDNPGSISLAGKLGFVREAEIDGWSEGFAKPI